MQFTESFVQHYSMYCIIHAGGMERDVRNREITVYRVGVILTTNTPLLLL